MIFEVGKYYKNNSGKKLHILVDIETTYYGQTLLAEDNDGNFQPVGSDETNTVNWIEIDKCEWLSKKNTYNRGCLDETDDFSV